MYNNVVMKIGFIGGGNMAEAMIKGMTSHGMKDILVSDPSEDRMLYLRKNFGVNTSGSNTDVTNSCSVIILAVKPQIMESVLDEISPSVTEDKTVVSIAAGITLGILQSRLNTKRLIRVMPNTPALVQKGMTVMSLCECFSDSDMATVREIFMSIGEVITLPEKYMDAVTAVSGSGPGFIAFFIEAMIEAGVTVGLSEDDASTLAVQTAIGTAKLLETGMPPAKLREMVTSPGGTTAAGLKAFEDKGLKDVVKYSIKAAKSRSEELGKDK
jgi:pyrroline-5-carboxylate reductase